jgi:butyryl-CoA dehydrogenase
MECNRLYDLVHATQADEKATALLLLEILTPIVKTYASEQGSRSAALAIQTLGGYGFTTDFPVQQLYRDLKIMSLYEGTTGIQSLDLLGRKVTIQNGKALSLLLTQIQETIALSIQDEDLKLYGIQLTKDIQTFEKVLNHLLGYLQKSDPDRFLSDATVFMEMAGLIVIGWQWLKMALKAKELLQSANPNKMNQDFYAGKIHTMEFYFKYELPHIDACANTLMNEKTLTNLKEFDFF